MLGGFKLKRDLKSWVELVDGIYAVSITLLLVSLPEILQAVIVNNKNHMTHVLLIESATLRINTVYALTIYLVITLYCLFLLVIDSWSIQRRQLETSPYIDAQSGLLISLGMFSSIMIQALIVLRIERMSISGFSTALEGIEFLIILMIFLHYMSIREIETRNLGYYHKKMMHRRKRTSSFSLNGINRRLTAAAIVTAIALMLRILNAPIYIFSLYSVALCISILKRKL